MQTPHKYYESILLEEIMTNDPNDRSMISELSSKLSSGINEEDTVQTSLSRDPENIGKVFESEIPPSYADNDLPSNDLFAELSQILDQQAAAREEEVRKQKLVEEEQIRQREEEIRQRQLTNDQQMKHKLKQEKQLARLIADSIYAFDPDQVFTSVRSGHSARYSKISPPVRPILSDAELKIADAAIQTPSIEAPLVASPSDAPHESPSNKPAKEPSLADELIYTNSPDTSTRGDRDNKNKGRRTPVIFALVMALIAVICIFSLVRRYSTNLNNLLTRTPTDQTVESSKETTESSESSAKTESMTDASGEMSENTADSSIEENPSANTASDEEGEITLTESIAVNEENTDELIPEDPNDISYIANINKEASENAITELPENAPRLYLSSYGIKIPSGSRFNAISFVENIEDDADDRDRLYSDISVDGLDGFDAKVPGRYDLIYFCYDSAGNISNKATLSVIVE